MLAEQLRTIDRRVPRFAWIVCLAAANASGQAAGEREAAPGLEVVVTGSRRERKKKDDPIATELIGREEIEAMGAETAADVLEEAPGIQIVRGFSGANVRLQGLDAPYVLILVDGQRVTGRVNGAIDLTRFLTEDIERIEIVRGPSSALYGSDALGGVINIVTRRGKRPLELEAHGALGNFGLADASASAGLRGTAYDARASAGWHQGAGFDLDPADASTSGNAFRELNLAGQGKYRFAGGRSLGARVEYLYRDQEGVDQSGPGAILDRKNRTETWTASLESQLRLGESNTLRLTAHGTHFRDQYLLDQRGGSGALDEDQETHETLVQSGAQLERWLFDRHPLTVGGELLYERLETPRLAERRADRYRGSFYGNSEWKLRPSLAWTGVIGVRLDADSQFGSYFTPKIATRIDPHPSLAVRASAGLGFRAPGFRELYLDFQNPGAGYRVEGNPALAPETSLGFQLGAEWTPSERATLSVNSFWNEIDNLIQTVSLPAVPGEPTRFRYGNIAAARTRGVETTLRVAPFEHFSIDLGYTLTDARDRTQNQPLEGRSRHQASCGLRSEFPAIGLSAVLRAAWFGPRFFYLNPDTAPGVRTEAAGYATIDLRLAQTVGRHLTVSVLGENLLDQKDARFLTLPGRTISGALTARY